ncbi:hypothetical protein JW964_16010, partial [candidate division KSB1 bacterium]|nr:hypothetical protein [candidate division KSB1 bacterium]
MTKNTTPDDTSTQEYELLSGVQGKPWTTRFRAYLKFLGPGFLQSAMTLGGGTASACLLAGSMYGYKLLWVQP